ncbi:ankyrin repeat-containing domain protein, partial [Pyronema omphalodes]
METNRNFEDHRKTIEKLYLVDDKKLKHVIKIMEDQHNFHASESQYKKRLKKWGLFEKNIPQKIFVKLLSWISYRRHRMNKRACIARYRGHVVNVKKIETGLKRYKNKLEQLTNEDILQLPTSFPDIECSTPPGSPELPVSTSYMESDMQISTIQDETIILTQDDTRRHHTQSIPVEHPPFATAIHSDTAYSQQDIPTLPLAITPQKPPNIAIWLKTFLSTTDENERTPLHLALRDGYEAMARLFIDHGADILATDSYKKTPLHLASLGGHEGLSRLLIEKGADISTTDDEGHTPLHLALEKGHERVSRLLIEKGADISTT